MRNDDSVTQNALPENALDKSSNKPRYLTPQEAATRLMVSPVTLRHWALAGKLAFVTTAGGHRRFAEQEVERFAIQHNSTTAGKDDGAERILIVDGDVQLTDSLVAWLQGLSDPVRTEVANDGFEAGQKLLIFRPHTVVLNLKMPGNEGFEMCRKIKQNTDTGDTRVVLVTGNVTPEKMTQALQAGADACLAKPLDKIQFLKAVGFR